MKPPPSVKSQIQVTSRPVPGFSLVAAGFFVLFFLYVWLRLEPSVEYHHGAPVFLLTYALFKPFLLYPGGLLDYAATFLAQLNFNNELGAMVATAMAGLTFLVTRRLLNRFEVLTARWAPYAPPFTLLLLADRSYRLSLITSLGLLLSLSLANAYATLPATASRVRLAAGWLFFAGLFYLAGFWPCLLCVACIWLLPRLKSISRARDGKPEDKAIRSRMLTNRLSPMLGASLLVLGWGAVWLAFDGPNKALAQIDYYGSRKEYDKVLATAAKVKTLDAASEVRLHLALFRTGRLGQDLFSFPSQSGWNLMPALSQGGEACRAQSETLLELGQVNLAERFAHEALEWEGERPDTLRLLAQVNLLGNRPQAAQVFLNVLTQIPFQRAWAKPYLRELHTNPRWPGTLEIVQIRSRMVAFDLPHNSLPTEAVLRQLLQADRQNQMAFEYLMTHFLLTRQADKLVQEIGRLADFQYASIPRHYEEALLWHQHHSGKTNVALPGLQIRPETLRRFQDFCVAMRQPAQDRPEGRRDLARDYGDTFWYHCLSGRMAVDRLPDRPTEP